jgi:hypothetical protein
MFRRLPWISNVVEPSRELSPYLKNNKLRTNKKTPEEIPHHFQHFLRVFHRLELNEGVPAGFPVLRHERFVRNYFH